MNSHFLSSAFFSIKFCSQGLEPLNFEKQTYYIRIHLSFFEVFLSQCSWLFKGKTFKYVPQESVTASDCTSHLIFKLWQSRISQLSSTIWEFTVGIQIFSNIHNSTASSSIFLFLLSSSLSWNRWLLLPVEFLTVLSNWLIIIWMFSLRL